MRKVKLIEIHLEHYYSDDEHGYVDRIRNFDYSKDWAEVSEDVFKTIDLFCKTYNRNIGHRYILIEYHDPLNLNGDMLKNMESFIENELIKKQKQEEKDRMSRENAKKLAEQKAKKKAQKEIENAKKLLEKYGVKV